MHSGENRNKSSVTDEALKNCLGKIKYKPFLANFTEVNGVKDFTSHDIEYQEDEDGNTVVKYIERQVGCFTADEPTIEYDEELGHNYVYANVAIPREYTDAAAIIERKGGTKVSAELMVNKMSYDADKGILNLEDIVVMGATALGTDPESGEPVQEGMEGAHLEITDFSADNNRVNYADDPALVEMLKKLVDERLEAFVNSGDPAQNLGKEGQAMENSNPQVYMLTMPDGTVRKFELSSDEIDCALRRLVNETYADDEHWYDVTVYPDTTTLVMENWMSWVPEAYRQEYSREGDTFSLVGERTAVKRIWATDEEISAIDQIKADKAELERRLDEVNNLLGTYQAAEAEQRKLDLLNSADYSVISDTDEYRELFENHSDLSIDEVSNKLNAMLLAYAKKKFAVKPEVQKPKGITIPVVNNKKAKSPYGGLFD